MSAPSLSTQLQTFVGLVPVQFPVSLVLLVFVACLMFIPSCHALRLLYYNVSLPLRLGADNSYYSDGFNANNMVKDWTLGKVLATIPKPVTSASSSPLHFLHIIQRLKTTPREGWRKFDIVNGESIADHMYRMGIITMLCPPEIGIDRDRCVKMALIHDMAEALVGDITPPDNVAKDDKFQRELDSMRYICDELLKPISETVAKEFMELWEEYETGTTKEAVFVKDVDRFELLCQTIEYEKHYDAQKDLSEFLHVRKGIKNDFVKKWTADALLEREAYWKSRGMETQVE